jgi:cytochrome c biogenesis protein CcdA
MKITNRCEMMLMLVLVASSLGTASLAIMVAGGSAQPSQLVVPQCLYFFESEGCHSCEEADSYIKSIEAEYPTLTVHRFEVHNITNWELMVNLYRARNMTLTATPVAFIGNEVLIGPAAIESRLESLIMNNTGWQCPSPNSTVPPYEGPSSPPIGVIFGMALADSLNPCAIAVLLLLIVALSAASGRVLTTGGAYIAGNFIAYVLIGFGLFSILRQFQLPFYTSKVIGALAIIVAILSLFTKIPVSQRPTVKKLIEGATSPPAAFLAGAVISAIELPCTGGPYFLALTLMSQYSLSQVEVLGYLLLYNLIFVLPLVLILVLYMFARSPKIPRNYIRYASAIAMLIVGVFLLLA